MQDEYVRLEGTATFTIRSSWMKDGEAMAKVIPGGAEVKPLQGGGKYEVVVVLGRSAVPVGAGPKK